jgi:hypothetical protein
MYNYHRTDSVNYDHKRKFGSESSAFSGPLVYGYPSAFPGVKIFEMDENYMNHLLGLTNSKFIALKKGLGELKDFVLFHEEEHVKDMSASELEVDKRALKRIKSSRKLTKSLLKKIKELMENRWGDKSSDLMKELE